ncbi:hypothetical protein PM082_019635 [Marasmius tenuissimus]|nr:hypothetical protein PM082_019635 [Marasmius tenuissimus]
MCNSETGSLIFLQRSQRKMTRRLASHRSQAQGTVVGIGSTLENVLSGVLEPDCASARALMKTGEWYEGSSNQNYAANIGKYNVVFSAISRA